MSVPLPAAPPPNIHDGYICCPLPFFPGKAFKNHDFHSAHGARYYYVTPHGAYSTREDCLAAQADKTPPVRVTTAELAGQEWWRTCRTFHPKCQERNVAGRTALQEKLPRTHRQMVGFTAVYMPDASRACSTSNAIPHCSAPFLFVICKTASIYFDMRHAHAESRRTGAKEVHVVRSFEEAVDVIVSDAELVVNAFKEMTVCDIPYPSSMESAEPTPPSPMESAEPTPPAMTDAQDREFKRQALDDIRRDVPHSEPVVGWLNQYMNPPERPSRSAEEIAEGREKQKLRIIARNSQPTPLRLPEEPPARSAEEIRERRADLMDRLTAKKARREMLERASAARQAPHKAPRFPPTIIQAPVASPVEEGRRLLEEQGRREQSEIRAKRVAHLLATRRGQRDAAKNKSM